MPRLVIASIILVLLLAYAVMFATWNLEPVKVVGLRFGGQEYWENVPVAYLPLIGVIVGVVVMAVAAYVQWQGNRAVIGKLNQQVSRAREVVEQQKKRISELEEALRATREELARLEEGAGRPGTQEGIELAEGFEAGEVAQKGGAAEQGGEEVEDDEVI